MAVNTYLKVSKEMASTTFNIASVRQILETHDWQSRKFSTYADEVLQEYEKVHYAVEHTTMNREDYELESYEFRGDLFVFYYIGDGATKCHPGSATRTDELVMDYYRLDEEFYDRAYRSLPLDGLDRRLFQKLKVALLA